LLFGELDGVSSGIQGFDSLLELRAAGRTDTVNQDKLQGRNLDQRDCFGRGLIEFLELLLKIQSRHFKPPGYRYTELMFL
jgi:hypothetical protein